ncbi:MAG TPA: SRPBCC domain-containing protein [Leptospiraceae bacterium]|nr:SRPBCC domain-containing protein [Leptospiraceae bacterium]HMW05831.1 SRPBCC domain-containing protein [Leptospiraceae bacterium]HMX33579.1 SRPBCC domain-containing protein [Leptospiraceae bacterium]HMY34377.1 SRPBCC domain-containing protein [Leptospiraceae bacterium]HMZ64133.1 SRPBCC domain-containing protein [Leptospiraceae bacterium]
MCKTIKQKVKFKASPEVIYALLANSKKHSAFTGEKAMISNKIGGNFSAYDGYITGVNVDLLPSKRIVQAWRGSDFPEGIFSMAAFVLVSTKEGGTELTLTHRGVPKNLIPSIEKGWKEFYWDKMKDYLAQKK